MLFALPLVLSSLFLPAACQFGDEGADGFHPDPITTGIFAILCIFVFAFGVLNIWTFVALLSSRGHRSPYAFLLPTLTFFAWSNGAYIAIIVLENIPSLEFSDSLPVLLLPALNLVSNLFNDWAVVLQFLAVIAVIWNRETALRTATEGKFGGHHPALTVVHAALAALTFIFGTAAEAFNMDTNVRFFTTDDFDDSDKLHHQVVVYQQLFYVYTSFAILTAVDVAVSTGLLWRAWRKAAISDKITNIMLYAVVPVYTLLSLVIMIFTILFSPSGLPDTASASTIESASLANTLLATLLSIIVIIIILIMSTKKTNWNAGGVGDPPKQQYWAPQPQYVYAAPPQVSQAGYYVAGASQPVQYAPSQESRAASYAPGSPPMQHTQYAPTHESSAHASYNAGSPPPMQTSQGSYSPPQSTQGPPVQPEKTGLHVA
ncbi:hypothetical protein C8R44DRAFT_731771 [Mycena epipterygia]|nr:hypothetical protein C8R44DRAFT_731771 [Mycena epipterygia]